jgi:hypothetical protein
MTNFLNWVYSQANKIYDWFGTSYYTLKNAAANAWNWAVSQAQAAYNSAVIYVLSVKISILSTITTYVNWLQVKINDLRTNFYEDLIDIFDWVEWKFDQVRDLVNLYVSDAIGNISAVLNNIYDTVLGWIQETFDRLWTRVMDAFGWVLNVRDRIFALLEYISLDKLQILYHFLNTWLQAVILFFQNPLIFILDVIQERFISFLCYLLAWGLGTTKYDLPNKTPWKD